jgi:hypothetical protein
MVSSRIIVHQIFSCPNSRDAVVSAFCNTGVDFRPGGKPNLNLPLSHSFSLDRLTLLHLHPSFAHTSAIRETSLTLTYSHSQPPPTSLSLPIDPSTYPNLYHLTPIDHACHNTSRSDRYVLRSEVSSKDARSRFVVVGAVTSMEGNCAFVEECRWYP